MRSSTVLSTVMRMSGPVPGDGLCQLSEAIKNANTNGVSDASDGDCTLGSGMDTIEFSVTSIDVFMPGLPVLTDPGDTIDVPPGTYTLSLGFELFIDKDLNLNGVEASSTIIEASPVDPVPLPSDPGVADFRVFNIEGGIVEQLAVV